MFIANFDAALQHGPPPPRPMMATPLPADSRHFPITRSDGPGDCRAHLEGLMRSDPLKLHIGTSCLTRRVRGRSTTSRNPYLQEKRRRSLSSGALTPRLPLMAKYGAVWSSAYKAVGFAMLAFTPMIPTSFQSP